MKTRTADRRAATRKPRDALSVGIALENQLINGGSSKVKRRSKALSLSPKLSFIKPLNILPSSTIYVIRVEYGFLLGFAHILPWLIRISQPDITKISFAPLVFAYDANVINVNVAISIKSYGYLLKNSKFNRGILRQQSDKPKPFIFWNISS